MSSRRAAQEMIIRATEQVIISAQTGAQAAYKNLMETMYNKAEQYVEDTKLADEFVGKALRRS